MNEQEPEYRRLEQEWRERYPQLAVIKDRVYEALLKEANGGQSRENRSGVLPAGENR